MNRWLWGYVGVVALAGGITVAQNVWDLHAADWASWVQAVGSIGAILASVGVVQWQNRLSRNAEDRAALIRHKNVLRAAAVVGDELCQLLAIISNTLHNTNSVPATYKGVTSMLADTTGAVQSLPLVEFDEATADQIVTIRRVCREVNMLASAAGVVQHTSGEAQHQKRIIDGWHGYVAHARDELIEYRKSL